MSCNILHLEKYLGIFKEITIHAPCLRVTYKKSIETETIFKKLADISEVIKPKTIVFHPDTIEDFSLFENVSFKVSLENMDSKKSKGIWPEEFEQLKSKIDLR